MPLSPRLLTALRSYWKAYRPSQYLFPGKTPDRPYAATSIQKAVKASAAKAGIKKNVTPHTLRHSYATGLLEAGVDILTISRLLGHASFTTTMVYLHVRQPHLQSTPSPLDWLPVRQLPLWDQPNKAKGQPPKLTVAEILRRTAGRYVQRHPSQAAPQVQSTLAKLSLCRTAALGIARRSTISCSRRPGRR